MSFPRDSPIQLGKTLVHWQMVHVIWLPIPSIVYLWLRLVITRFMLDSQLVAVWLIRKVHSIVNEWLLYRAPLRVVPTPPRC